MVGSDWSRIAYRFSKWYGRQSIPDFWFPPRLRTRECMFQMWGSNLFDRHINFDSPKHVMHYLTTRGPKSCFYSTAYYGKPLERKMADKDWKGADLIFDLDGDHLPQVDPFNFPEMLEIIQDQAWCLWNDFLEPEFGFNEDKLHVTFSGHRGFHLHYRDPNLLSLDSSARRELVNYIRGEGVEVSAMVNNTSSFGWKQRLDDSRTSILNKLDIAAQDSKQGNSMTRDLCQIIKQKQNLSQSSNISVGPAKMKALAELVQHPTRRQNVISGELHGLGKHAHIFLELVKGDKSLILGKAGETDEAVTVDIKRQIRWPNSLNGKCGYKVTSLPLERLRLDSPTRFNALREAVPGFDNKTTEMEIVVDRCVLSIDTKISEFTKGDQLQADSNLDSFLTLKGWAKVIQN